jgi:hypothetical protein
MSAASASATERDDLQIMPLVSRWWNIASSALGQEVIDLARHKLAHRIFKIPSLASFASVGFLFLLFQNPRAPLVSK